MPLAKATSALAIIASIAFFCKLENHQFANASHTDRDIKISPYQRTTLYHLAQTYNEYIKSSKIVDMCYRSNSEIVIDSCSFTSPNIILIIGESFNKHHSSLYDYHRDTNPLLSKRKGLIVFNDVVAPANLTHICFNRILSTSNADDKIEWYRKPLFPAIFKKAGYNVTFFSNQFTNKLSGNQFFSSFLGSFYFDNKKMEKLMFDHRNTDKYRYDMSLLDSWKEQRSSCENQSHNLIILHLIGQHLFANNNYPKEYEHFTADSINRTDLSAIEKLYLAGYNNATRYNDMVVNEIFNIYSNNDAIVIYFSDHGDEVYDFRNKLGRSFDFDAGNGACAHCQLDVPFLVYPTETYRKNHPEMVEKLEAAVNRPFMTDDLPHMLLELAGISTPYYDPTRSLINDNFNTKRRRLIVLDERTYDYDAGKYVK